MCARPLCKPCCHFPIVYKYTYHAYRKSISKALFYVKQNKTKYRRFNSGFSHLTHFHTEKYQMKFVVLRRRELNKKKKRSHCVSFSFAYAVSKHIYDSSCFEMLVEKIGILLSFNSIQLK
jgi:hypothetical protein